MSPIMTVRHRKDRKGVYCIFAYMCVICFLFKDKYVLNCSLNNKK
jgi:hypothetical protein